MTGFHWDEGNLFKNLVKHNVTESECEEVFFDPHNKQIADTLHSEDEDRFIIIGQTKQHRLLYVVYTIRGEQIRVISARNLNRKERHFYE